MDNCIFCKIVSGEIPSSKIYEDENVLSFLDVNPVNEGHSLIIPKKHFENIYDLPDEILCEIIKVSKKLSIKIKESMGADGINVYMNNGITAGQQVPHAHIHIIPRLENDGFTYWHGKKSYSKEERNDAAEKISKALQG